MPPNGLVDNDVLIKLSAYQLIIELETADLHAPFGVLGSAKYIVRDRLSRDSSIRDKTTAQAEFESFLHTVESVEPTDEEVEIATRMEEAAAKANLALDAGESQLCALVVSRKISALLTGDKRAVIALESVLHLLPEYGSLAGSVLCLEQIVRTIGRRIGFLNARRCICAEPGVDTSLRICFECGRLTVRSDFEAPGLASYIAALRSSAPSILADDP